MKKNGVLREAWFIDGLRKGLGRSIVDGRIGFIGEYVNDSPYCGMAENEDGKYEGYF